MTVNQALRLWPKLMTTKMQLSSPAVARRRGDARRLARPVHERRGQAALPGRLHHAALVRRGLRHQRRGEPAQELYPGGVGPLPQADLADRVRAVEVRPFGVPHSQSAGCVCHRRDDDAAAPGLRLAVRVVRAARPMAPTARPDCSSRVRLRPPPGGPSRRFPSVRRRSGVPRRMRAARGRRMLLATSATAGSSTTAVWSPGKPSAHDDRRRNRPPVGQGLRGPALEVGDVHVDHAVVGGGLVAGHGAGVHQHDVEEVGQLRGGELHGAGDVASERQHGVALALLV